MITSDSTKSEKSGQLKGHKLSYDQRRLIGKRIKTIREIYLKMELQSFSERIHINKKTLNDIEDGSMLPSIEVLISISELSGRSTDWILMGKLEKSLGELWLGV